MDLPVVEATVSRQQDFVIKVQPEEMPQPDGDRGHGEMTLLAMALLPIDHRLDLRISAVARGETSRLLMESRRHHRVSSEKQTPGQMLLPTEPSLLPRSTFQCTFETRVRK